MSVDQIRAALNSIEATPRDGFLGELEDQLVDAWTDAVNGTDRLTTLSRRSATVTLIDTESTPTPTEGRRRWPIVAVAAAAVVAIVVGALMLAAREDSEPPVPADTTAAPVTVVPDTASSAEEVTRGFVDAFVAGDADRALTYLTDDLISRTEQWRSPEGVRRDIAWQEAARFKWNVHDCQSRAPFRTVVRCGLDFHVLGSDAIGLGPYDVSWDLTVRDGKIVSANRGEWVWTQQVGDEMWGPFGSWIRIEHPDDVLVMYADSSQTWSQVTDEALRLWEQRTEEYVQAVLTGETYPADVAVICATQAAQLAELTVPAEGALDQVAAWNTAAATIIEQAHQDLTALDKPPGRDTTAYTSFYSRLVRLVPIAEQSAEAATAGDSARLAELELDYLDVRQDMDGVPTGSGLEECIASLPT